MDSDFAPGVRFKKTGALLESEVDSEVVALDIMKGQCYGLNSVGSRIWRLLDTPNSLESICASLQEEYDVEAATCREQVVELLSSLQAEGLIDKV